MAFSRSDDGIRTLADAVRGEVLEIGHIAFDGVRELCDELGLARGDVVLCRGAGTTILRLETAAGRTVDLERRWAMFVEARRTRRGQPTARRQSPRPAPRATLTSEHQHEHVVQGVGPRGDAEAA